MMTGYKTYLGAALIGIGAIVEAFGYVEIGRAIKDFGLMLMGFGIGAKIVRLKGVLK